MSNTIRPSYKKDVLRIATSKSGTSAQVNVPGLVVGGWILNPGGHLLLVKILAGSDHDGHDILIKLLWSITDEVLDVVGSQRLLSVSVDMEVDNQAAERAVGLGVLVDLEWLAQAD